MICVRDFVGNLSRTLSQSRRNGTWAIETRRFHLCVIPYGMRRIVVLRWIFHGKLNPLKLKRLVRTGTVHVPTQWLADQHVA